MTNEMFYEILGDIDEKHIREAFLPKRSRKAAWKKGGRIAACLCLVIAGGAIAYPFLPADFGTMIERGNVDSSLVMTQLEIDGRNACYAQLNIDSGRLERYVGEVFSADDSRTWYYPKATENRKYLLMQAADGTLSAWEFSLFTMEEGETYTYGEVMQIIYGIDSAEDIVSITTTPSKSNNTDQGQAIQRKVGRQVYTDEADITAFYDIVKNIVCYGVVHESDADNQRFTYSFSTGNPDKLTSGESTYGTRCIEIEIADGSTLDSWKYSALSGSFYEYGGIFTQPLSEEDVHVLNNIFGIR